MPDIDLDSAVQQVTALPQWQQGDMTKRKELVRDFAAHSAATGLPDEQRGPLLDKLYDAAGSRGVWGTVGFALKEAAKSIPAGGGAVVGALSGSEATDKRLTEGVQDMADSAAQRIKSLDPNDYQETREQALTDFKADLDNQAYPPGLVPYLAGEDPKTPEEKAAWKEGEQYFNGWSDVLLKTAVLADKGDKAGNDEALLSSHRSSGRGMWDRDRSRDLMADYMATRDPDTWNGLAELARETETSWKIRLSRQQDQENYSNFKPETSLLDELSLRAADMQRSPIDMAMTAFPLFRGAKALKAAYGGRAAAAIRETAKSAAGEFVSGAASEAFTRGGSATDAQVMEAGGMEALGSGTMTAGSAAAGAVARTATNLRAGQQPATTPPGNPASTPQQGNAAPAAVAPDMEGGTGATAPGEVTRLPVIGRLARIAGTDISNEAPQTQSIETPGPTPPAALATPGTAETPPIPDAAPTVAEQARLAADKSSTRKAVLITPGTPRPPKTPGLMAYQGDTNGHGIVLYNPKKVTPREIRDAVSGDVFDATVMGFSQPSPATETTPKSSPTITGSNAQTGAEMPVPASAPGEANVVTASTPTAQNVQAEVVTPEQIPAAIAAAQAAVPGGTVEVKPAAQVAAERTANAVLPAPNISPTTDTSAAATPTTAASNAPGATAKAGQSRAGNGLLAQPTPAPVRETPRQLAARLKSEARAAKAAKGKGVAWFRPANPAPGNEDDALAWAMENKIRSMPPLPKKNKLDGSQPSRGGEWDKLARFNKDMPAYYGLVTSPAGVEPDVRLMDAIRDGIVPEGSSVDDLLNAIRNAIASRQKYRTESKRQEKLQGEEERAALRQGERRDAAWRKDTAEGPIAASGNDLSVGDTVDVDGTLLTVVERSDTAVLLRDGDTYGEQWLDNEDIIRIDAYTPDFTERPGNPDADRVEFSRNDLDPFRGDFFSGTEDDVFNLVAETAADRQKREARELKEQIARDQRAREEAKRKADSQQGTLFAKSPPSPRPSVPPSREQAASAVRILRANAPELLDDVRLLRSAAELDPNNFHPDDWLNITDGSTEAFYSPRTGQTTVVLDNVSPRPGESAIGAVARVIMHERLAHAGLAILRKSDKTFADKWAALTGEIPPEELAALIPLYPHLAENPDKLAEEWFARRAEQARIAPPGSLLRRMWEALKAAVARLWKNFAPGKVSLDDRVMEMLAASRKALRSGDILSPSQGQETGGQDGPSTMQSRLFPYRENRDWQSWPMPQWLKDKFKARAVAAYEVQAQGARAIITGSVMPAAFAKIVANTQEEIRAIQARGAAIGRDLHEAIKVVVKRTGLTEPQISAGVNAAMEDPAKMAAITDPVLKTRATAARNFVDTLSHEVAATTGGVLGQTITQNAGHWLRRGYAVFDGSANWNKASLTEAAAKGKLLGGKDARKILTDAHVYLTAQHPALTPAGIDAMVSDLLDRDQWQSASLGIPRADGAKVSRETSSFMARKEIAPQIRALLGEEVNPIKRLSRSIGIQAQLIARHDQQVAMRDLGLRMGVFSLTQDGTYHRPVGGDDVHGNMRWNGFTYTDPATGEVQPVYTTPEMLEALNNASAVDGRVLGGIIMKAYKALGAEAKMNKVALNPDSWAVNILGGMLGMVQSGDMFHFAGWQRVAEAVRIHRSAGAHSGEAINAVAEALTESRRAILGQLTAAGVAGSSFDLRDLEASLDNSVLAFIEGNDVANRAAGVVRGAVLGQAFGAGGGAVGRAAGAVAGAIGGGIVGGKKITGVQKKIAQAVLSTPDNIAKIAVYLGNYSSLLASGMTAADAHALAAEKTRNTMPDYSNLPALLREGSKLGLLGSFIAFQFEVYRNYFHNIRYAMQELRATRSVTRKTKTGSVTVTVPNMALVARGMRRMLGAATVTALGGGVLSMIAGAFGGGADDDKDAAYRRSLGAPWERFGDLAYTQFDKEKASFFNTSYLVPQTTLFEIARAASEGKSFGDGLENALVAARRQFASGSVHADPVMEALMNTRMGDKGKVSYEEGLRGIKERIGHIMTVSMEPGAANKLDRLAKAMRGEEIRGRKFSGEEELVRFLGVRQSTYTHEQRMRGRIYEFRDDYQTARDAARKAWKDSPQDRPATLARANERIASVEARWQEFQTDMKTLGIPKSKVETIRGDVGLGAKFYRLAPGKDGPEAVK